MTTQTMLSPFRRAISDFEMINRGDQIAVGLSGGKDSLALVTLFAALKKFYPEPFELFAVNIDMGLDYDESEKTALKNYLDELKVPLYVEKTDIGKILFEVRTEKNPCSLCSKLRRGALCSVAVSHGATKIALGHHADDLAETLFLSLFFEGRLSTFEPVTFLDDLNVSLIRPLIYTEEKNIRAYAKDFPVLHNPCPADKHTNRQYIKELLASVKKDIPFAKSRILTALCHPERNHLFGEAIEKLVKNGAMSEAAPAYKRLKGEERKQSENTDKRE